jgi:hypothetical protein
LNGVAALGTAGLVGLCGIILLAYGGRPVPESLIAVVSASLGALSSFLVMPPRGSVGVSDFRPTEREGP